MSIYTLQLLANNSELTSFKFVTEFSWPKRVTNTFLELESMAEEESIASELSRFSLKSQA